MKHFLAVLFLLISNLLSAQDQKKIDSLSFCSIEFQVPSDCIAESAYQIQCDDYTMGWLYFNKEMFEANVPEQFIDQMGEKFRRFKKEPVPVYLLDKQVKGYKVSFKVGNKTGHQIIAYGIVNEQPVLVQLSLNREPKTNSDIPDFPLQILKLKE